MRLLKSKLAGLFCALAVLGGTIFGIAPPASAASYGWDYLVVFNSRCIDGGDVYAIYGSVTNTWSGGDAGDNIIYARTTLHTWNEFNGYAYCSGSWETDHVPYIIYITDW